MLQTSGQALITMGKCMRTSLGYPCSRAHTCLIWTLTTVMQPGQSLKEVLLICGGLPKKGKRLVCCSVCHLFVRDGPEAVLPSMPSSTLPHMNHVGGNKSVNLIRTSRGCESKTTQTNCWAFLLQIKEVTEPR